MKITQTPDKKLHFFTRKGIKPDYHLAALIGRIQKAHNRHLNVVALMKFKEEERE